MCVYPENEFSTKQKIAEVGTGSWLLSEINSADLLYGVKNSSSERRQRNRQDIEAFQGISVGRVLRISNAVHEYARQKRLSGA